MEGVRRVSFIPQSFCSTFPHSGWAVGWDLALPEFRGNFAEAPEAPYRAPRAGGGLVPAQLLLTSAFGL